MEKRPKISVIMPVYNAQRYIVNALESLISQTFEDLEIIVVNNNSTDKTGAICAEFAKKDSRITALNSQENLGPGKARNLAIDISKGEYIIFMDGDDTIESDMLEILYSKAIDRNCDVVVCGYFQDFLDENDKLAYTVKVDAPMIECCNNKECIAAIPVLDVAKVMSFSWNKIYRASVIKENNVRFPDMRHSEDYFFLMELMRYITSLYTVSNNLYHYNKTKTSTLTNQPHLKGFTELVLSRFATQKELLESGFVFEGDVRSKSCAVHIKHIFSALENSRKKASGMSARDRRKEIKMLLSNEDTVLAIRYAGAYGKAQAVMNAIIKTRSPFVVGMFVGLVCFVKNNMSSVFNKLKVK